MRLGRFALALLLVLAAPLRGQTLEIRFLDVGQGDAILIRSADKVALVDAGPSGAIAARLADLGVDTIDLLVASHNHADHISGADAVLRRFPVRFYLDNGLPQTTRTWQRVIAQVRARNVTYLQASARTITLGDAQLTVLAPPFPAGQVDQNNASVGIIVTLDEFHALLTGDSETAERDRWLARDEIPDVDVLKAAHHGSSNGVTPAWLARAQPEVIVISVGRNSYGHPHAAALRLYESTGAHVYRTDESGDVIVSVIAGGTYFVTTARATPRTGVTPNAAAADTARVCCRVCTTGKACGNSCISRRLTCHQPRGCACDARP